MAANRHHNVPQATYNFCLLLAVNMPVLLSKSPPFLSLTIGVIQDLRGKKSTHLINRRQKLSEKVIKSTKHRSGLQKSAERDWDARDRVKRYNDLMRNQRQFFWKLSTVVICRHHQFTKTDVWQLKDDIPVSVERWKTNSTEDEARKKNRWDKAMNGIRTHNKLDTKHRATVGLRGVRA